MVKLRQLKGIYWVGSLLSAYSQAAAVLGGVNLLFTTGTFYIVGIQPWLYDRDIILPMWSVVLIFITMIAAALWFSYAILISSHYVFMNNQLKQHGNFTHADMQELKETLEVIKGKLKIE